MITGIIIALADEINSLTSKKIKKGDTVFISENILVCCSGAGPENAKKASQLLINKGATKLISWGCAAALNSELNPGDLIVPVKLFAENNTSFSIDSPWLQQTIKQLTKLSPNTGLLAESHSIVANSSDKSKLHQKSNAIALDMESVAIAQTAIQNNCEALVIRCIADPASMSLPKAVSHALNKQGDVVLIKLLWFLLCHPSELPGLIKLGLHFNAAKNKLKLVAGHLDIIAGFEQNIASK